MNAVDDRVRCVLSIRNLLVFKFMLILSLLCIVGVVTSNTECIWAVGKLVCHKNQTRVLNSVVEIWDKDGPKNVKIIDILDPDDKAGLTVVDNEDGIFKVEGCAADFDWLGPIYRNRPEFYFKVRHNCNSDKLEEISVFPPHMKIFAPRTMDYYMNNPIGLDSD